MGKRSDRIFHLTVSALALTLTAVSAGTLVYEHNPKWIARWAPSVLQTGATKWNQLTHSNANHASGADPSKGHPSNKGTAGQSPLSNTSNATGSAATDNRTGTTGSSRRTGNATGNQTKPSDTTSPSGNITSASNAAAATGGTTPGASSQDIALKPTYHETNNALLVKVKPYGSDVSTTDIKRVNDLLTNERIIHLVSHTLHMNIFQQVTIVIAKNAKDYQGALSSLGINGTDAQRYTLDTGGFTQGGTVVIPLYQNTANGELANTLAHELTHAFLNANVGENFPSWMNEGLAVSDGMTAEAATDGSVAYDGYARLMAESILSVASNGNLMSLVKDEQTVLSGKAPYDLELQDWLAVRDLIQTKGTSAFSDYFYRLQLGETESEAFQRSFGSSESAFNKQFTNHLVSASKVGNDGVTLNFQVQNSFHGAIRFLQHGIDSWTGFRPVSGSNTVHIATDGTVTGASSVTSAIQDSNPPDKQTLYVNLDPSKPFTYNGKTVQDSGFAIDYHNGMYGFVNGWLTLTNGKSIYVHHPKLFGVTLTDIQEDQPDEWLLDLLNPLTSS